MQSEKNGARSGDEKVTQHFNTLHLLNKAYTIASGPI